MIFRVILFQKYLFFQQCYYNNSTFLYIFPEINLENRSSVWYIFRVSDYSVTEFEVLIWRLKIKYVQKLKNQGTKSNFIVLDIVCNFFNSYGLIIYKKNRGGGISSSIRLFG